MEHHHVAVADKLESRARSGGALHRQSIRASRHRQHDVERLSPVP
jgi:hypothetical protein